MINSAKVKETVMNKETYQFFLAGLAHLIKSTKGISQKKIAAKIGYSEQHLSNVMTGSRIASDELIELLAGEFSLDKSDIAMLGKNVLHGPGTIGDQVRRPDWIQFPQNLQDENISSMSKDDLSKEVGVLVSAVFNGLDRFAKEITRKTRVIERDRNRLLDEKNRLLSIFESMSDAVKITNKDRVVTFANRSYLRMVGTDVLGQVCPTFCDDEKSCYIDSVILTGLPERLEKMYNNIRYDVSASPLLGPSGAIEEVVSVIREIEETKRP